MILFVALHIVAALWWVYFSESIQLMPLAHSISSCPSYLHFQYIWKKKINEAEERTRGNIINDPEFVFVLYTLFTAHCVVSYSHVLECALHCVRFITVSARERLFECMCVQLYRHLHAHCQMLWNSQPLLDTMQRYRFIPLHVCHRKFSHRFRPFAVVAIMLQLFFSSLTALFLCQC